MGETLVLGTSGIHGPQSDDIVSLLRPLLYIHMASWSYWEWKGFIVPIPSNCLYFCWLEILHMGEIPRNSRWGKARLVLSQTAQVPYIRGLCFQPIPSMDFGGKNLKSWVLGPPGFDSISSRRSGVIPGSK